MDYGPFSEDGYERVMTSVTGKFVCPTWKEPGRCVCGKRLPPMSEWKNAGSDWSSVECSYCGRSFVDEEEFIAIYEADEARRIGAGDD